MRILWHLYLLIGLVVAAGAEPINNVPGCEDAPTASKETSTSTTTSTQATPSTGTTETETSTSTPTSTTATPSIGTTETESPTMRTTETGAREKDEPKYGYYTDYYGCFYKVLKSRGLLYHANCLYYCPWKPHVYRVRDGVTCLTILEKGAQERAYRDSKVCRKGRCFNGLCIPTGYVQGCTVPNTFPRNLPRNTLDHSE
ncbi:hypothetical protein MRX96_042922 [Rhipicephalus microplus]